MGEGKPKIRWWTYVVAAIWAAVLVGVAFLMRFLRLMSNEMPNELGLRPPFTTRAIAAGMLI